MFDIPGVGEVVVFTEDHPPPHVHVLHRGEGWVVRIRFSFLSDVVGLYGVSKVGRRPSGRTVSEILAAIEAGLPKCRARWWAIHSSIGLEGRWAEVSADGVVRIAVRQPAQARRVLSAGYDAAAAMVTLGLDDDAEYRVAAGQGIEEAEEWS